LVALDKNSESRKSIFFSSGVKKLIKDKNVRSLIDKAMAKLATVDSRCTPHLVPVVFIFDGEYFHVPIDDKIKQQPSSKPERLERVRNIQTNPNVILLIDEYNEDTVQKIFSVSKIRIGNHVIMIRPQKVVTCKGT
jgi:hypothetical protein